MSDITGFGPDRIDPYHAPERVVRQIAAVFRPGQCPPWRSLEQHRAAHLAQARLLADQAWAEAYHHGASFMLAMQPARMVLVMPSESA